MKRILVIVVTHNGLGWVDRCLGSVRSSETPADLFVVDNDSSDTTADKVQGDFPEARLVRSAENLGFSKANNLGLKYALEHGYDYAYLLNQDAWLLPDTLGLLVAEADAHPEYAILSPMQMKADGSGFDRLFAKNTLRKALGKEEDPVREVPCVMAAHWLVRVSALPRLGLLAPIFPLYGEDDNYCDRVHFHGMKVGIVPAAQAVHDRADRQEPQEKIIHRNYFMGSLRRLCDIRRPLWERRAFVLLFTIVKTFRYRSLAPWRHHRELHHLLPEIRTTRSATRASGAFL